MADSYPWYHSKMLRAVLARTSSAPAKAWSLAWYIWALSDDDSCHAALRSAALGGLTPTTRPNSTKHLPRTDFYSKFETDFVRTPYSCGVTQDQPWLSQGTLDILVILFGIRTCTMGVLVIFGMIRYYVSSFIGSTIYQYAINI